MSKSIMNYKIIFGSIVIMTLFLSGCGQKSDSGGKTREISQEDKQFYSCGMHPNVIQEGPGNCPICGMNLTPIGGVSSLVTSASSVSAEKGERKILYWRAPMDPTYITPKPGKSPMGMDLIPVYEGEEAFGATVRINPTVVQNMGVRIATVRRRNLSQKIRTIGRIDYDESKVAHVHTKFTGWIEKTYVNTTGEHVEKGQDLLEIYSPKLVSAQEEYLDAYNKLRSLGQSTSKAAKSNMETILASAKRRLEYFDVTKEQIERIEKTGEVNKTLMLLSPHEGIVVKKHALDGMEVKSGMNLYTIVDLSEIWVYADIYEYETPWIKVGQPATMTLSYNPGKKYKGQVQYIYPYLEEKTRTIKVRLVFPNDNLELKPGMYANVDLETSQVENVIAVPMEAVLFSGERNFVIVSLGEGRFAPRDVTIGIESGDGYYEVKEGLSKGEKIVISGQFLIDSESKLQESIAKLLGIKSVTDMEEKTAGRSEINHMDHENEHE
ncbi:MAG: efflux RND transporter periplasmic adaptor subunit [Candidatus Marinimicrobia bacterium]|nr:efflux RND transporter periplasmic adaptor subunit [Candidatus Neomarinimicrobiota bacterium]